MLFLLVMEVLHPLTCKADKWAIFDKLAVRCLPLHMSLYAVDVILFLSPTAQDMQTTRGILRIFDGASDLGCNFNKCQLALIRCTEEHMQLAGLLFPCPVIDFPLRYLGILLSIKKLPWTTLQLIINKMVDKLLIRKGRLMN
jgi:hypothetical protein